MNRMTLPIGFFVGLFFGMPFAVSSAHAAQLGTVIVDEAAVRVYPQAKSESIGTVHRDQKLAVSNLPTEGFYKVRLPDGEIGWISGNDVFVGAQKPTRAGSDLRESPDTTDDASTDASAPADETAASESSPPTRKKARKELKELDGYPGDYSRILLMIGGQWPSYNGFKQKFVTEGIDPGYGGTLEFQFRMSKHFHWATRAEFTFSSVNSKDLGGGTTQTLKQSSIPLQLGINYSPVTNRGFRLGLGVYAGMVVSSSMVVSQSTSTLTEQVEYSSVDPTALGMIQMSFGLGKHIAMIGELGYRYEKTGTLPKTTRFGGNIGEISIDYSGPVGHVGFEFRF